MEKDIKFNWIIIDSLIVSFTKTNLVVIAFIFLQKHFVGKCEINMTG